jgi:hypothetical protein
MRPDWHATFRYAPDGTLWYREQITVPGGFRRIMNRPVGYTNQDGYLVVRFKRKHYRVHRIIWEMHYGPATPGLEVDHKNNIRKDNRIENLQELTHRDNSKKQLTSKASTTGYRGVRLIKKNNRFSAQIKINRKQIHLGCFSTAEKAYEARKAAELHYYGPKLMVSQ